METQETIVAAWLRSVAERWEHQPDTDEIHMAFPTKRVRTGVTERLGTRACVWHSASVRACPRERHEVATARALKSSREGCINHSASTALR